MISVKNKKPYLSMFQEYKHNIPVIYSSLEGQYDGTLYVDEEDKPKIAVLFTPFAFHFVAGEANSKDVNRLDELIFNHYLKETNQKEVIVFAPNANWYPILDELFNRHHGIKDVRKIFSFNVNKFQSLRKENNLPIIKYEKDNGSHFTYPVASIYHDDKRVSFCSAFMIGNNQAELDVGTEESFQKLGYATQCCFALIEELLKNKITPNWSTWRYRVASQHLALKVGFEPSEDANAYIWVEDECGKL